MQCPSTYCVQCWTSSKGTCGERLPANGRGGRSEASPLRIVTGSWSKRTLSKERLALLRKPSPREPSERAAREADEAAAALIASEAAEAAAGAAAQGSSARKLKQRSKQAERQTPPPPPPLPPLAPAAVVR